MGFIWRKILFPACETMCICCPAMKTRSRQPVKRYKKLLAEIFRRSPDGQLDERSIKKLCEYAAKNPFRIPKIAKYLEERCYKELRSEHINVVIIVTEAYKKLLSMCTDQMVYFSVNLLNVIVRLLEDSNREIVLISGCQTLTSFIYAQVDGTYTYNIENLVHKICKLARSTSEEDQEPRLRASSLQCLSAMIWFMAEFSHFFLEFDEIVTAVLDNYDPHMNNDGENDRGDAHHNWVDEVVRCEGRGGGIGSELSPGYIRIRTNPGKRDTSLLTREEIESSKVWAQICIQRMVELAKESSTMRRVLDPMFVYFDTRSQWVAQHGLAQVVLSHVAYFLENSGNQQLILTGVVRHLDHKNVSHDLQVKSYIVQTATALLKQLRSEALLSDTGFVSDLCRHLRKSLQATVESVSEQELTLNLELQTSIENCLLETARGIVDVGPLFDIMAITLEKLPSVRIVARATIGSLIILAHMISLASTSLHMEQVFPDGLLIQILKVMLHPDVEVRVGGHRILSAILIPASNRARPDIVNNTRSWHSNSASTFASINVLLSKLRREKDGAKVKDGVTAQDDCKERDTVIEDSKQGWSHQNSPNIHKIHSIFDKATMSASLAVAEQSVLKFNEDQIAQLLSVLWIQANLSDNLPANVEAMAHSFCLILISSRLRFPSESLVVRFFQLPLSLRKLALDSGSLSLTYRRSLLVLSTAMLLFAAKIYHVPDLINLLKSFPERDGDTYIGISEDFQIYLKPEAEVREYGSAADNQMASSLFSQLQYMQYESEKAILDILVKSLSTSTELEADELVKELSEGFMPDDAVIFGSQMMVDMNHVNRVLHSKDSTCDGDFSLSSCVEDDAISETSVGDLSRFIPRMPTSPTPSMSHIVSIGKLMESALEVAGQVAGSSVSTSPLPYSAMASQCEVYGTDSRKKLSNWLVLENHCTKTDDMLHPSYPASALSTLGKMPAEDECIQGAFSLRDPWLALRLPPASPFDNFLRAARRED